MNRVRANKSIAAMPCFYWPFKYYLVHQTFLRNRGTGKNTLNINNVRNLKELYAQVKPGK